MSASSGVPQGYRPPQGQTMQPLNPGGMQPLNPGGMVSINPDNRPAGWSPGSAGWASNAAPAKGGKLATQMAQAIGRTMAARRAAPPTQPSGVATGSPTVRLVQALRARAGK